MHPHKDRVAATREDALAKGLKHYSGKPCPNRHDGLRYTNSHECVTCQRHQRSKGIKKNEDKFFGHECKMIDADHLREKLDEKNKDDWPDH